MNFRALAAIAALCAAAPAVATPVTADHIEAELVAEHTAWIAGTTNWVAVRLKPEGGWHTYWRNPGDSGLATTLAWTLPAGWKAGDIAWPYPSMEKLGELTNYGYAEETLHLVPLAAPAGVTGKATAKVLAKWLVCKDICIPGKAELSLELPVAEIATADPRWTVAFADARSRLPAKGVLPGHFQVAGEEVRVQVDAPEALAGANGAEFFAYANNLVNHGKPQRVALDGASVRFTQAQSAYLTAVPESVDGLLVVQGAQKKSYVVAATTGEVAVVPMSAAPAAAPDAASVTPGASEGSPAALAQVSLLVALGFAVLGGLILNLMPCVFPVLSIKAVSVLENRRGDPAAERAHALAYAAGVVGSCVAAALALVLFRGAGENLGWGFQLQSPVFVALLAYLMLALGLSLSGVVQFGTELMGVGQGLTELHGYAGSFFTGVLAVVVASPCVAPFMGTALGFAMTQPVPVAILVFAALGLGLALPFLLLGFFPALGGFLPRPGAWMETFKQFMAFPLYLTVAWLLWVLGRQSGVDAVALALCGLVALSLGFWAWSPPARGPARTALALAAFVVALGLLAHPAIRTKVPQSPRTPTVEGHVPYSEAKLAELRAQGRPVFVNFTADWCITCKVNEKVVFEDEAVKQAVADNGVTWMTADWTNPDPVITAALARFGRSGVPLYLLYPVRGEPEVLPQVLTPRLMIDALTRASRSGG